MHYRFGHLLFLLAGCLFMASQAGQAQPGKSLHSLDLPYGKDRSAVVSIVQNSLEKQMYQQIRATNDPVKRASLGQKREAMSNTLANSYQPTIKDRSHFRLSPITGLIAIGPNSGVLQEKSTGSERYLLFFDGRLYGAAVTLSGTGTLPEIAASLSGSLGKPSAYLRKNNDSDSVVLGVEWKKGGSTFLLKDFSADYGVRLLARLHTELWDEAKKATDKALKGRSPGDQKPAEDLLEEFLEK